MNQKLGQLWKGSVLMLRAGGREREFLPQASRGNPLVWVAVHPVTDQKCSLFRNWTLPILLFYSGFLKSSFVLLVKIWLQVLNQGDFVLPIDTGRHLVLFLVVRSREWGRRWHFSSAGQRPWMPVNIPQCTGQYPLYPNRELLSLKCQYHQVEKHSNTVTVLRQRFLSYCTHDGSKQVCITQIPQTTASLKLHGEDDAQLGGCPQTTNAILQGEKVWHLFFN